MKFNGWLGVIGILSLTHGMAFAQQWGELPKLKDFVGIDQPVVNADAIESMRLNQGRTADQPWSDTFWPDVKGSIAWPYNDDGYTGPLRWSVNRGDVTNRAEVRRKAIAGTISEDDLNNLSPAEKHDLIMGDANFTLTKKVIEMVDQRDAVDLVASWSGVCHGWSPAALSLPRPTHVARVRAPNGRMVTFYPSDVKALMSFLWGKSYAQNFVKVEGWQCQGRGVDITRIGRLTDPRCFDVNPGFFHLITVNQIGVNRRGFIMDRNFRTEVQNQPVYAYSLKYFKVTDRHPNLVSSFRQAVVPFTANLWDPYRNYRSPRTRSLVGVEATVRYAKEAGPSHATTDDPSRDDSTTYTIRYDLELDANNQIIGGEWREFDEADAPTLFEQLTYKHPDLIWLVPANLTALSVGSHLATSSWDGVTGAAPTDWRTAALQSATLIEAETVKGRPLQMLRPQPLDKLVYLLLDLSRR